MTVFVVNDRSGGSHDLTPAAKFGTLRYVNQYYIHGDELDSDSRMTGWVIPPGYRLNIERAAAEFDPDIDCLLIYGDHLQLLAFTMVLATRFEYITVLRWDRNMNDYIPVRLYSGLVPPGQAVVVSGTHIGETEHGQKRNQDRADALKQICDLESPLIRRAPRDIT